MTQYGHMEPYMTQYGHMGPSTRPYGSQYTAIWVPVHGQMRLYRTQYSQMRLYRTQYGHMGPCTAIWVHVRPWVLPGY